MTPRLEPEAEQELLRRVQARVRHWRGRVDENDYEDMLSEAYLKAWQSYLLGVERGVERPLDYALRYAGRGPANWLRDWYGKAGGRERQRAPEPVPWEEAEEAGRAAADPRPGPEEIVLTRIERHALWNWLRRCLTPRQIEVLALFYRTGLKGEEIARVQGRWPNAAFHVHDTALKNGQVDEEHLPSFLPLSTRYPRCRRGHYLTPENIGREEVRGKIARSCLLCKRAQCRASHRKIRQAARNAPQSPQDAAGTASGPPADPGHPHAENGGETAS